MVASAPGSTGKCKPVGRRCSLSAMRRTPACTRQSMSASCTARTRVMRRPRSRLTPPHSAATWPSSDVPAPNGTTGAPSCLATRSAHTTSPSCRANTTTSGGQGSWKLSSVPCSSSSPGAVTTCSSPSADRSARASSPPAPGRPASQRASRGYRSRADTARAAALIADAALRERELLRQQSSSASAPPPRRPAPAEQP